MAQKGIIGLRTICTHSSKGFASVVNSGQAGWQIGPETAEPLRQISLSQCLQITLFLPKFQAEFKIEIVCQHRLKQGPKPFAGMEILSAEGWGRLLGHKPTSNSPKKRKYLHKKWWPRLLEKIAHSYQKDMAIYPSPKGYSAESLKKKIKILLFEIKT